MSYLLSRLQLISGAILLCALMGCGQSDLMGQGEIAVAPAQQANLPNLSPYPARVVLTSVEGPPVNQSGKVTQRIESAALAHQVQLIKGAQAEYFVRMYMATNSSDSGASLTYVWDVFDAQKRFQRRLEDRIAIAGTNSANLWTQMDEPMLNLLAERCASDLASFLAQTPEARAGQGQAQMGGSASMADVARGGASLGPNLGFAAPR
jgi:hypothetical protein